MGGGSKVKQTNEQQAAAANAAATGAATQAQNQGNIFSAQQQQLYNLLYGGGSGGGKGVVGGMLDPNSLNVTKPTGVYALQNTNANTAAAKQYAANAGNIKTAAAQAGFNPATTPAGFTQDQLNQNARALADTRGTNFANATNQQYQDALANFWKAANVTAGGAATTGGQANQATGTAANTYANLYGTAGHGNVTQNSNLLGNTIAAGGQVGAAAMCVAAGTMVRLSPDVVTEIEELAPGDAILGIEGPIRIIAPLECAEVPCLRLLTEAGLELFCSPSHTLLRPTHGYVRAKDALGEEVLTWEGKTRVIDVEPQGPMRVVSLQVDGSHTYCTGGIWSEE